MNSVSKYTAEGGFVQAKAMNIGTFKNKGIPFTYLEVEFYDNKTAMEKYKSKIDEIATEMAKVIKKEYP